MIKNHTNGPHLSIKRHRQHKVTQKNESRKDKTVIKNQFRKVYQCFSTGPKTMLQVAHLTGIERANICRYVAELRKSDRISFIKYGLCPISKHRAGFYETERRQK